MSNFGKNKFFPLEKVKILKKNFTKFAQLKKRKKNSLHFSTIWTILHT